MIHENTVMGVALHGMHTDETFTQRLGGTKMRHWKTIHIHNEYALYSAARYGVYTPTLLNVEHNCPSIKSIYLVLGCVDMPTRSVPRRSLLALRLRNYLHAVRSTHSDVLRYQLRRAPPAQAVQAVCERDHGH
jgi:hypothetical protein